MCIMRQKCWGGVFETVEPPVEKPETPTTPPSTEDLLTIKIEDEIMAVVGTNTWNAIAYGNGKYVAVGTSGYIATSTDGENWDASKPLTTTLTGVAFGDGFFVAVDFFGIAYASPDGINWTKYSVSGTSQAFYSVAFGDGKFIAVGDKSSTYGFIAESADMFTWTSTILSELKETIQSVIYDDVQNRFAAVSYRHVLFSEEDDDDMSMGGDSLIWRPYAVTESKDAYLTGIAYDGNTYMVCGQDQSKSPVEIVYATSSDGISWSELRTLGPGMGNSIAYINGHFVICGYSAAPNPNVYTSIDGQTWNSTTIYRDNSAIANIKDIIAMP